jgi:hypothetical protein
MTAIGWLVLQHLRGLSQTILNPASDQASIDLEVMVTWAYLNRKLEGNKQYRKRWPELTQQLAELAGHADNQSVSPGEVTALRLEIRMEQLECLVTGAVEEGLLDVASLPMDDQRRR